MITSEQQYEITGDAIRRLEAALQRLGEEHAEQHPLLQKAMRDGLAGEIEILRGQRADYDANRTRGQLGVHTLEDAATIQPPSKIGS